MGLLAEYLSRTYPSDRSQKYIITHSKIRSTRLDVGRAIEQMENHHLHGIYVYMRYLVGQKKGYHTNKRTQESWTDTARG